MFFPSTIIEPLREALGGSRRKIERIRQDDAEDGEEEAAGHSIRAVGCVSIDCAARASQKSHSSAS